MSLCFPVFMFSRKSGTSRPTFLRKPEMPRTTWCVPFSFSHFFMFLFSQECPSGGHTSRRAQPESFDYYRFTVFSKIAELNITVSSGLHLFTKNRSYYPACSKRFQSNYCAKVGARARWIRARPGSIRKNNSSLEKATTVTYKTFHSLDIRICNSVIFSCFVFHGRLSKTFMQTSLDRFC